MNQWEFKEGKDRERKKRKIERRNGEETKKIMTMKREREREQSVAFESSLINNFLSSKKL